MKNIILFLFSIIAFNCFSQTAIVNQIYTSPETDQLPSFTDDPSYINDYIARNFKVSEIMKSQEDFYSGILTVQFVVDSLGVISEVKCYDSRNVYIEQEFKRIITAMPRWKPAVKNHEFVTTRVFYPIAYQINNNIFEIDKTNIKTVKTDKKASGFLKLAIVGTCAIVMWLSFFNK